MAALPGLSADRNRLLPDGVLRVVGAAGSLAAELVEELGDQAGPAGLVAGADAAAGVAVEVLVEGDEVAPVRVALEFLLLAEDRAATVGVEHERGGQAAGQLGGDLA